MLPPEIWMLIISHLDLDDLMNFAAVCSEWTNIAVVVIHTKIRSKEDVQLFNGMIKLCYDPETKTCEFRNDEGDFILDGRTNIWMDKIYTLSTNLVLKNCRFETMPSSDSIVIEYEYTSRKSQFQIMLTIKDYRRKRHTGFVSEVANRDWHIYRCEAYGVVVMFTVNDFLWPFLPYRPFKTITTINRFYEATEKLRTTDGKTVEHYKRQILRIYHSFIARTRTKFFNLNIY